MSQDNQPQPSVDAHYHKDTNWTKATTIGVMVYTLFTLGLLMFNFKQLNSFENQLKVLERQQSLAEESQKVLLDQLKVAQDAQRSWITPTDVHLDSPLKEGMDINITVSYQNIGRDPARELTINGAPVTYFMEPGTNPWPENITCKDVTPIQGGEVVFPSSSATWAREFSYASRPIGSISLITSLARTLFFHGCIGYETLGKFHKTKFCYILKPKSKGEVDTMKWNFVHCPTGYTAD
jgi:hypothetical protein